MSNTDKCKECRSTAVIFIEISGDNPTVAVCEKCGNTWQDETEKDN